MSASPYRHLFGGGFPALGGGGRGVGESERVTANGKHEYTHANGIGEGGQASGCGRVAPAPEPAALPCLNRNNSISKSPKPYRFRETITTETQTISTDKNGDIWTTEGGVHTKLKGQDIYYGPDRKRSFLVRELVADFAQYWGREHSLFFTQTALTPMHPRDFSLCWNSFLANEGDWLKGFLKILEPQKSLRPHYHTITAVDFNTLPDQFDWVTFKAACAEKQANGKTAEFRRLTRIYAQTTCPELQELWKRCSPERMKAYGLGFCEILPIRSLEAMPHYLGKYLNKGMDIKIDAWKGSRKFETDRTTSKIWKCSTGRFSWVSPGAKAWRRRVGELAFALGLPQDGDIKSISKRLGPKWAYNLSSVIITGTQEEWVTCLQSLAVGAGRLKSTWEYDCGDNPF